MKRIYLLLTLLICALAITAVASEDVGDVKKQFNLTFQITDFGDHIEVSVNLPKNAQGTVNYTIGNENHEVKIVNGEAKFNITNLKPGQYTIKANYSGDDVYMSVENQTIIIVKAPKNSTDNNTNGTNAAGGDDDSDDKNSSDKNQTPQVNNTTDENVTTTVDNSPPPEEPPFELDAKTGIPILLVIIAAAILIVVRKYQF